ncbi:hypothetical protein JZ751_012261, partial [Albula glossodonta]
SALPPSLPPVGRTLAGPKHCEGRRSSVPPPCPLGPPDEWEHSSNGSTGSRPSSGSRPGSGSRSGSRGRNNQFRGQAKNGNREGSFDILGTDIWAANTLESHGGATWDLQPEKLDFTQFHRKPFRGTPKHLPHIDREGMMKGKFDDDDGIDLNDMEKFLPGLTVTVRQRCQASMTRAAWHREVERAGDCLPLLSHAQSTQALSGERPVSDAFILSSLHCRHGRLLIQWMAHPIRNKEVTVLSGWFGRLRRLVR